MADRDPLDDLIVRPGQIEGAQRQMLRDMVAPFAGIDVTSGTVHFREEADMLSSRHRVLVYLLARIALAVKSGEGAGTPVLVREASPKEIERDTGLPGGTVRPALKHLVQAHLVHKGGDKYTVPASWFKRAFQDLQPQMGGERKE